MTDLDILIADDEPKLLDLAKDVVEMASPRTIVRTAPDGEQALAEIVKKHPNLLITDYNMPGLSGLQLIRKARTDVNYQGPVIIMSAGDYDELAREIKGMSDLLVTMLKKPYNIQEFMALIRTNLGIGPAS
jgi:DNA-binding response OmpR family regulator